MKNKLLKNIVKGMVVAGVMTTLVGCGNANKSSDVINVATNAYFAPYEYYDDNNQVTGIDIDIINEIGARVDKKIVITDMDFENLLTAVSSGKVDCTISAMTVTPERKTQVLFTDSYTHSVQKVVVKNDSNIDTIDDLADVLIGVQGGTTGALYASGDFDHVAEYSKVDELKEALENNKIEAIIIDAGPANDLIANNSGFKTLETAYADEEYAIAINKNNTELYTEINNALNEMITDGTIDVIFAKYNVE